MMRFSLLLVGLSVTAMAAVACGGSDDDGGGGAAGKGGGNAAGTNAGTSGSQNNGGSGGTSGGGKGGTGSGTSGSGSGTPGGVDSGLPDGTPAGELTDAQFDTLCQSIGEAAAAVLGENTKKATCGYGAYVATSLSGATGPEADAACKMAYDECLAEPDETTDQECKKPSKTCTATVGEVEKCFNDQFEQLKSLIDDFPGCEDLGTEYEPPMDPEPPASCAVLEQKCPEALD